MPFDDKHLHFIKLNEEGKRREIEIQTEREREKQKLEDYFFYNFFRLEITKKNREQAFEI